MPPQNNVADELFVVFSAVKDRGRRLDRSFDINKPRTSQAVGCIFRILIEPGFTEARKEFCKLWSGREHIGASAQSHQVRTAATLSFEPSSGNERLAQVRKQAIMIEHPMKCRRAHDAVKRLLEGKMLKVTHQQTDAISKLREMLARRSQHVLREVHSDHAPARQGLKQVCGETSGAASGVEHDFIAAQPKPRQNFLAPANLRPRKPVVHARIPLARTRLKCVAHYLVVHN